MTEEQKDRARYYYDLADKYNKEKFIEKLKI